MENEQIQLEVLKRALAETVERKRTNTRERIAYKKATPVDESSRIGVLRSFWGTNATLKEEIRALGLAYAFLRGRRYWVTERSTSSPMEASVVATALGDAARTEEIAAWLAEKPGDEERLAFEAYVAAANAKARTESRLRSAKSRAA